MPPTVDAGDFTVKSGGVCEYANDGVVAHEAIAYAINSYDSNQELLASLKKDADLAKERSNKARKSGAK